MSRYLFASATLAMATTLASAAPVTIGFERTTSNSPQDISGQLGLTIDEVVPGTVDLTFANRVGVSSSVAEIYLNGEGLLEGLPDIEQENATFAVQREMLASARPGNLPGAPKEWTFTVDSDLRGGDSDGLDHADDYVTFRFAFAPGADFQALLDAIADGHTFAGLHVRSIGDTADSDSYLSTQPLVTPVPLPTIPALAAIGLAPLAARRRRDG